jgi:hypothetical protein
MSLILVGLPQVGKSACPGRETLKRKPRREIGVLVPELSRQSGGGQFATSREYTKTAQARQQQQQ